MSTILSFFPIKNKNTSAKEFYAQNLPTTSNSVLQESNKSQNDDVENRFQSVHEENIELQAENVQLKEINQQLNEKNTQLRNKNAKLQNDLKKLLKLHRETCRMYVNKELKIKILKKSAIAQSNLLYESFKNDFGEEVLKKLRKFQCEKSRDSTFILVCMRELFKTIDLKCVTASGTGNKSCIPSDKREILERIFLERLASDKLNDSEQTERYMRLNRHINVAISNMLKTNVSFLFCITYLACK